MNNWRIKSSMVATSMVCILAGSTAWAEQGAPPGELETLKRMMQEVISENQELRMRVRELEEGMTKVKAAMTKREQAPEEAAKEAAKEPAKEAAKEAAKEPAKEAAKEPVAWVDVDKAWLAKLKKWSFKQMDLEIGIAAEVEVGWRKDFAGKSSSDIKLTSAEINFDAKPTDWSQAEVSFEFNADDNRVTLNEAILTIGDDRKFPLYLKAGLGVVPFGSSAGETISAGLTNKLTLTDPLTISVFESKEDYAWLGVKTRGFDQTGGFDAGVYVFNGSTNDRASGEKHLDHYGAAVSYSLRNDRIELDAAINMINSVFDSDGLTEHFPEAQTSRYSPGISAHLRFLLANGYSLATEYSTALLSVPFTRNEQSFRIRPTAWHIEAGYTTEIFGKKTYGALGYSQTYQLAGAFPERRMLVTVGTWLLLGPHKIRFALEYGHEEDYPITAGGTGRAGEAFKSKLTYEY
jgi:hypothetical protein